MRDLLMLDKFKIPLDDKNQLSPSELPPEFPTVDTRFAIAALGGGRLIIFEDGTCGVRNGFGWYLVPGRTRALPLHKVGLDIACVLDGEWQCYQSS